MYVPAHFAEDRIPFLHDAIRASGLATLVTLTEDGLIASHVPLLIDPEPAPYGTLIGHIARPNPQKKPAIGEALAIFLGLDSAIHAYGTLRFIDDPTHLLDIVTRLTNRHEGSRDAPWAVSDAPADFVQGMLKGIVGFELTITRLQGKWKMSQNRPAADRTGVVEGLNKDGQPELAREVAEVARTS
jgi:transcriptional regulator